MKAAHWGVLAFVAGSATWMSAAALLWGNLRSPVSPAESIPSGAIIAHHAARPSAPFAPSTVTPPPAAGHGEALVRRLLALSGRTSDGDDDLALVKRELLELGEQAAQAVVTQLPFERDPGRRALLLDLLRAMPGAVAENALIEEAEVGALGSHRTLAMDALAERRSDATLAALEHIATSDPELPSRPFIAEPRQPGDESTELPDEAVFTPRMKAIAALASTRDARVTDALVDILLRAPDESLRMEAARHLAPFARDPAVLDALLACLSREASAYVRLAALHALSAVVDPRASAVRRALAERDPDRGVQILARQQLPPS